MAVRHCIQLEANPVDWRHSSGQDVLRFPANRRDIAVVVAETCPQQIFCECKKVGVNQEVLA
ncbi:hypothetical protein ACNKHS_08950 [Shigella flexneri]